MGETALPGLPVASQFPCHSFLSRATLCLPHHLMFLGFLPASVEGSTVCWARIYLAFAITHSYSTENTIFSRYALDPQILFGDYADASDRDIECQLWCQKPKRQKASAMDHHYHKTCTEWSSMRLYNPYPSIKLQSQPSLTSSSSPASSATLTPTSPSPATTPPKTFLDTNILSTSPPSFYPEPSSTAGSNALTLPQLDALHADLPFTHLPCPHPDDHDDHDHGPSPRPLALHADAILVSCTGTYRRHNGVPRGAASVHFSAASPLNAAYALASSPDHPPLTRQRVELLAGIKALERVEEYVRAAEQESDADEEGSLSQVVVRTHSQYLVRGAVEMLPRWKERGWTNSRGRVVANVDLFWYLDRRITWLEWMGVEVLFLLVGREDNAGAVGMVKEGL